MANIQRASFADLTLLDTASNALRELGIRAELHPSEAGDARIDLLFANHSTTYLVECKRRVTSASVGAIASQLSNIDHPLLVAEYIAPPVADRLRQLNVQFVDMAGNAYLHAPPILVWVTGRKPETPPAASRIARAFQPSGLKLIFALLCKPELAGAPYRDLAAAADVALGSVGWAMRDLKDDKYLLELGTHGRKLINRRRLLEQWSEEYARQLRPKLLIGRFRSLSQDWQTATEVPVNGVLWGGETAAAKMTNYLKPAITTIYLRKNPAVQSDLLKKLRLVKDTEGNVELREIFWHCDSAEAPGLVPPLLVYADLLATADDRNLETARIIYEKHLARFIE
ncbi:MAG: type IV toxin-antitoxin system AbiEi family antitoxin [Bacillota bacterium]